MLKKKIIKIVVCSICLIAVLGYGVYAFSSYQAYRKEKAMMTAGETSESIELFHDQGHIYMSPVAPTEKDDVTIRMRSGRYQVTKAQIQITSDGGTTWTSYEMTYEKPDDTGYYDIWVGKIPAQSAPYFYRFAVGNNIDDATMYLGVEGTRSYQIDTNEMFYVIPGFDTPDWSKGTMWYYAHIGQFYNGDTTNDLYREYLMKDNTYGNDSQSMYRGSGDIAGLKEKLEYIQDLGVTSLAVGPFFSSSETLGFGTDNMAAVETAFGTEESLQELISEIHDRDMKITTDMIISYSTNYSKYFNVFGLFPEDGAYQSKDSQYYNLFRFPQWPYNAVKVWGSIGLNVGNEEAAKLIYQNKDSMVLKYLDEKYGLDGYRFDAEESVGNLGYEYEPKSYFEGITSAIKGVSEDKLVLAENCTGIADQYNTLFDSSWQKNGYFAMKGWFEGTKKGSEMLKVMQDNLINTARPRALSSYNFLGQHDVTRLWDDTELQRNDIQSLLLLQMTYLGSPVIYYGDEVGATNGYYDNQYYSAFNWDESEWDYHIYNLVKSLGQLRKHYSCLREGAICHGEVDDAQMFLSFGRFDDKGSVITLCNKQSTPVEREINVSRYHVKDGAVLTDYLTGAEYKVKDGKVTVNVIPGGTILVTGKTSSENRDQYTIADLGADLDVVLTDTDMFEISGKGTIKNKKDKVGFVYANAYNNAAFSAGVVTSKSGQAGLMLRDSLEKDSAAYVAVVSNQKLTVYSRTENGKEIKKVASLTIQKDAMIRVARESDNQFVTYYKENEEAEWSRLDKTVCCVAMSEDIYAGMTVLKGSATFSGVSLEEAESQICETFEGEVLGSMFGTLTQGMELKSGKLILISDEELVYVATNAHASDYTFKTEVGKVTAASKKETTLAGVMAMTESSDAVVVGRAVIDGQAVLVFGKLVNGKWQMNGQVTDTQEDKNVTLQLQRIGSLYTAVASYDGQSWFTVGESIYSNYTGLQTGLCTLNATASFEYGCFGDSITDSLSTNTPITLGEINTSYVEMNQYIEADKMTYLGNEGSWNDIGAGYEQTKADGIALLYCENKLFEDVKAEATIQINGGNGTAGILVGKQKNTKDLKDCYQIALNSSKELAILLNGKELASCKLKIKSDSVRLVVRLENGYLHVYAGLDSELALSVKDETYQKGYAAYYTEDVKAAFTNYDITVLDSTWNATKTVMGTDGVLEIRENDALVSLEGVGITEGILTFQMDTKLAESSKAESTVGAILGGSFGKKAGYGGLAIMYNYQTGVLEAKEVETSLGSVKLAEPDTMKSLSLMVIYRRGTYDIYANQSQEPVLSVKTSKPNGGGINLYSSSGNTLFYNTCVCDITGITDVESLDIVKAWGKIVPREEYTLNCVPLTGKTYTDGFPDYTGWQQNFFKIKTDGADWYLKDGVLKADSKIKNWNIATITSGLYKDVEVSLKVKFNEYSNDNNSAFSINLGKQNVYAGREDTGLSLTVFGSGLVRLYDTEQKQTLNGWSTYVDGLDKWFDVKFRVSGGQAIITIGEREVYSGNVGNLKNGYIALQSDYVNLEVDNLSIKPLS